MADDIAPELLEKVQSDYRKLREKDEELARISERTAAGSADGKDLDAYAVREGELLAEALHRNVSGDVLPNGKMYFNIADRVLPSVLRENYDNVADMSERIIAGMNDRAGIHIRAQRPELNEDRVKGLVNLAATADQYEDRRKEIEADVVNFSQSVGTDTVRKNADFQYQSGLSPKIHRTAEGGCCKWCAGLAGTYDYASVKGSGSDVWQRHRDCRCIVEFDPGNGKRQNAHTKAWRSDEDRAKRIEYSREMENLREERERNRKQREGELSQHKDGDKVNITDQAIEKVKAVGPSNASEEERTLMQELNREILKISRDKNNGDEVAMALVNGKFSEPVVGDVGKVNLYADPNMYHLLTSSEIGIRSVTLSHNHPGLSYFSIHDIGIFVGSPNIKTIEVVTNAGKTWYITKKDNYDDIEAMNIYKAIIKENKDDADKAVDSYLKRIYNMIEKNG